MQKTDETEMHQVVQNKLILYLQYIIQVMRIQNIWQQGILPQDI